MSESINGDSVERCGSVPQAPLPSLKRVGWVMSAQAPYYRSFIHDDIKICMESYGDPIAAGKFDTPVFVQLYTHGELDAARERAVKLAANLRVE
jgi:hypothetical protein